MFLSRKVLTFTKTQNECQFKKKKEKSLSIEMFVDESRILYFNPTQSLYFIYIIYSNKITVLMEHLLRFWHHFKHIYRINDHCLNLLTRPESSDFLFK